MAAYNELNGVPATGNSWLLTDVLRGDVGLQRLGRVRRLRDQQPHDARISPTDEADAAVRALKAGVDIEMPDRRAAYVTLADAIRHGAESTATLDTAVARILDAKFRLGLFEHPSWTRTAPSASRRSRAPGGRARRRAQRSAVLLKNEGGVLPLDRAKLKSTRGDWADR